MERILDVDLLAFERGDREQRAAVVDGVMRSLATGFVYTRHDMPEELIDRAYVGLADFFTRHRYPHRYRPPVLPEEDVPGITDVLMTFHRRLVDVQLRFLRIIAVGLGCHEEYFDLLLRDGPTLTRAISEG